MAEPRGRGRSGTATTAGREPPGQVLAAVRLGLQKPLVTRAQALAIAQPLIEPAIDNAPLVFSVSWRWGHWVVSGHHWRRTGTMRVIYIQGQAGEVARRLPEFSDEVWAVLSDDTGIESPDPSGNASPDE